MKTVQLKLGFILFGLFLNLIALGQTGKITGKVISKPDNLPLSGVSVIVKGSNKGTQTNENAQFSIDAKDLGLQPADVTAVRGGDPAYNAAVVRKTLSGEKGAVRDIVLLNAAAGLVVGGLAPNMAEGLDRAAGSIDSGAASNALDKLIAVSSSVAR